MLGWPSQFDSPRGSVDGQLSLVDHEDELQHRGVVNLSANDAG